jgi:glutamyl-tRNA synthetase
VMAHLRETYPGQLAEGAGERVVRGMPGLKERAKTIPELAESAKVYALSRPLPIAAKAAAVVDKGARHLAALTPVLAGLGEWNAAAIETAIRDFLADEGLELRDVAQPLRAALTGSTVSPPLFDVMAVLGQQEALGRLHDALGRVEPE